MLAMVNNLQELVVGEVPNLLNFWSMFSNAMLFGIMPPLAFALFGKRIPGMSLECFAGCRLFFVGFMFAFVAIPLKTGYVVYDVTLLLMAVFVAVFLYFGVEEASPRPGD